VKREAVTLPVITIDTSLVKSTNERNKQNKSVVGEMFDLRTPNVLKVDPLKLPMFTMSREPDDAHSRDIDLKTPLEELIQPKKVMRTAAEIEAWIRSNYYNLDRPMQYIGHEANTMDPTLFETADLRVLIVRLSAYDAVGGSMTHGALAQVSRQAAKDQGFNIYIDFAFMPASHDDCLKLTEGKVPWLFGRTTKRHPSDFDVILVSFALTMESWNITPALVHSGIHPFKTSRKMGDKIRGSEGSCPVILAGGVVGDCLEMIYGKVGDQECIVDATLMGDSEMILPGTLKTATEAVKKNSTKAEFLRAMHDLKETWFYEPDLYVHHWEEGPEVVWTETKVLEKSKEGVLKTEDIERRVKYQELVRITQKPEASYATKLGHLMRCYMPDLNEYPVFTEQPIHYDGLLGNGVDIQISSGCLCVHENTVIETDVGFETIKEAYDRLQEEDEKGGCLVQTRFGIQGAEAIVKTGIKTVNDYVFEDENGNRYEITCTKEHKFDVAIDPTEKEKNWTEAGSLDIGQEVWACNHGDYNATREANGTGSNSHAQFYYRDLCSVALLSRGPDYEAECYDIQNVENHEYIANGMVTHNSGGLCSFCLAEGTNVAARDFYQVPIEKLHGVTFGAGANEGGEIELETPYGQQVPEGVIPQGKKKCVTLTTKRGFSITGTPEHRIMAFKDGLIKLTELSSLVPGDIAILTQKVTKGMPQQGTVDKTEKNFLFPEGPKRGEKATEKNLAFDDMSPEQQEWIRVLRKAMAYGDAVVSVEDAGEKNIWDVWDVPEGHVYYANGFIVSNCHEAHTQGRWRERTADIIMEAAERAVRHQGAEEAGFYSLTWSLHSQVYTLLLKGYQRFGNSSLISQRADQASADPNFFAFQNRQGMKSTTIGVEGISQRMRNYFNKSLHTDQLFRTVENAARGGMTSLKLFQILSGLETQDDIDEYCELLREIHRRAKVISKEITIKTGVQRQPIRMNASFMLLLTMPHTSLQWAPCTSSFNLESDSMKPVVDATRECGFGFRTSLTRDRVRVSQWTGNAGREATKLLVETGLRCNWEYFGPIQKKVTWVLEEVFKKAGYDWYYWFREKDWDTVFPWDGVATPMRRDYLWNQWLKIREFIGIAYCLKTSVNLNPKCHDCGACEDHSDRKFMLTRTLEDSTALIGKESARRDMTVRKRVRYQIEITDPLVRTAPKAVLGRYITRALMLEAEKLNYDHEIIYSFLHVDGTSLKWAEGQGTTPWTMGKVLIDHVFNKNWDSKILRDLLPKINSHLWGFSITDFVASDRLVPFSEQAYGLYTVTVPDLSYHRAMEGIGKLGMTENLILKKKVAAGKGAFRSVEISKTRSTIIPVAMAQMTEEGTKVTILCSLSQQPLQGFVQALTGVRASTIRPYPILCLGYYKYDRKRQDEDSNKVEEGDIFAALAGDELYCELTGEPIETDLFTGELYKSVTAKNLCLAADLANLRQKREFGLGTGETVVKK
jgi:hypothetical protein